MTSVLTDLLIGQILVGEYYNGVATYCLLLTYCMFILHTGKEIVLQKLLLGLMLYMVNKKKCIQQNTALKYKCMRCFPPVNTVYLQLDDCRYTINCDNKKSWDLILYNMHAFII